MAVGNARAAFNRFATASSLALALLAPGVGQAGAARASSPKAPRPPNIVLILADDLGHNDISLNGNPLVRTPNIDSIAHDGVRFATGYSGDAICAPSRAALITGRNPERFGFEYLPYEANFAKNVRALTPGGTSGAKAELFDADAPSAVQNGLPLSETTLPQLLKSRGYATGMFGKWHLGTAPQLNPVNRGFDEFIGVKGGVAMHANPNDPTVVSFHIPWSGNDKNLWLHVDHRIVNGLGKPYEAPGYMSDVYANEAVRFIHKNKAKPFFLYLPFDEPHMPLQAPKKYYDQLAYIPDEKTRVYYAMIEALDHSVGTVLKELKAEGLDKNTLVIFTSDNGGSPFPRIPMMNLPYRGWKITYFEGGVNVPYFMRWPGHIRADSTVTGIVSQLDIFPTAAALAGASLPAGKVFDGQNLMPILSGGDASSLRDRELVWRKEDYLSIRKGDYKLQVSALPKMTWLFDLARDPTERINLASAMPAKVAELRAALDERVKGYVKPAWSPQGRVRVDIDGVPQDESIPREYIMWTN
ncbi:MAG TPA: sulfatase-like hydrolase/transferase [Phenylobacterium sp.]|jgi:arylsulfatase A-like enzyme|nr:sulfatase-like hydrolase/transferase [Phenylobacterium sp.]